MSCHFFLQNGGQQEKKEKSKFKWTFVEENLKKYHCLHDTNDKERIKRQKTIDELASLCGGASGMHIALVTVGLIP